MVFVFRGDVYFKDSFRLFFGLIIEEFFWLGSFLGDGVVLFDVGG